MDILRVLSSTDLEVRKKTLDLVMELVTLRNIEEVKNDLIFFDFIKSTTSHSFIEFPISLVVNILP